MTKKKNIVGTALFVLVLVLGLALALLLRRTGEDPARPEVATPSPKPATSVERRDARSVAQALPPQAAVNKFLSLHGFDPNDPVDLEVSRLLMSNPAPYVDAIRERYPTMQSDDVPRGNGIAIEDAAAYLASVDYPPAHELLVGWYTSAPWHSTRSWSSEVRKTIVAHLRTGDDRVRARALAHLTEMPLDELGQTTSWMLREYSGDADLAAQLEAIGARRDKLDPQSKNLIVATARQLRER